MKRPTLEEIFRDDEQGSHLLGETVTARQGAPSHRTGLDILEHVTAFQQKHGRLPAPDADDHDEMYLAAAWASARTKPDPAMKEADRLGLLALSDNLPSSDNTTTPDWRDESAFGETPTSLASLLADDDPALALDDDIFTLHHVSPAATRLLPDHQAKAVPCRNFQDYASFFARMEAELKCGTRKARPIRKNQILEPAEGDFFIRNGLVAYIAEKSEKSLRNGERDHRLRVIFSNKTESDPLMSSFRKSLTEDKTARAISRIGLGPLAGSERVKNATGTLYVARSLSSAPAIRELQGRLYKIGVTGGDVRRRIADARNDPTFLMAAVDIVATYTLVNLSHRKVEDCLHRFFADARAQLHVRDRLGKTIYPREWFLLPVELISQAARLVQKGTLNLYQYDHDRQMIIPKHPPHDHL